jgi:type I restriction enzyme S subunit
MKGAPLSKADITDEGTPFVLYGELYTTYGEVTRSIKRRTDKVVEPQFYSKVGDVIMPTSGETPEDIATASCIMLPDVILAGDLLIYRTQKVDGRLVSFVVKNKVNKQISSVAQGKSVVHVRAEELSKISISYPSDAEQQKILTMLELLEYKMAKQRELIEHLKKYKRGLLSSLLDKEEWQTVLMQDVACGFDYGMNSAATEYDGKHKYIRITDIDESTHKYISTECVSPSDLPEAKYKVEENDILFARTGASVGKSYIYDSRDGDLYYAGFLIRASVKPDFNSYFVYLNTLTLGYQRWVVLESTRSGQPGINAEQYRNYKFKCPPIEIQNKIANIFIHFDLKLQREQEILYYLLNYKKAMMKNIFV